MENRSPAPVPTSLSLRRIALAVEEAIPDHPRKAMRHQRDVIMVGVMYEMPAIRPSYPELASTMGCVHSTAMRLLDEWRSWSWQDRYGWMRLIDGRIRYGSYTMDAAVDR